ncbi:Hok/Gef family protein [Salmonella enterica]|nr:type I toxin-antitoxin system hok family toxin [Salmonella enterica]EHN6228642.1 Hok/Gef family protein [Salmonella enterica]
MSQKPLKTAIICITTVLIIWMLHGSLCELRMRLGGAEFAAFLRCEP